MNLARYHFYQLYTLDDNSHLIKFRLIWLAILNLNITTRYMSHYQIYSFLGSLNFFKLKKNNIVLQETVPRNHRYVLFG